MGFTLRGVRLIDAETEIFDTDITINGTRIQAIGHSTDTQGDIIDATDMIAMPGFIDIHTHGGGGFNLHTVDTEEIRAYARWVATTGVTSFLIGVVGVAGSLPEEQLSVAVDAIEDMGTGAEPLGIHMEGPYISVIRRGAHPPEWLRMPNVAEMERVLALAKGHLRLIALAPELPGAPAMIRQLVDAGVTVSIGHTDATYQQALEAIPLGITHITHCFNAMRPIHHRTPGPIEANSCDNGCPGWSRHSQCHVQLCRTASEGYSWRCTFIRRYTCWKHPDNGPGTAQHASDDRGLAPGGGRHVNTQSSPGCAGI